MKRERQPQSNGFLWEIDNLQTILTKISFLNPELLNTSNRKDIELRIRFLDDVINHEMAIDKTKYYKFISESDKGISRNPERATKSFINLFHDINQNKISTPILIGKYTSKKIKTRYIIKNKKSWSEIENITGYQLLDGAHRLAIALFKKMNHIPVKIIKPLGFEIPNYTEYLKYKEKEYL
ncbi:hypothetical protein OAK30_03050 [Candidatus Nitrosopelagicus sp.]|nr:hypothetical protein [Candidatus Nitrosopelagicus sp.]|tara:strand:- start:1821 stop:2363 length:543 start_codon:yes stop_codon:yes gene_type:complete